MKCWHCGSELIWGGDFSFDDYGLDGDGIISNLSCSNLLCQAYYDVYLPLNNNEDNNEDFEEDII